MATMVEQILGEFLTRLDAAAVGDVPKPTGLLVTDDAIKYYEAENTAIAVIPVRETPDESDRSRTRAMEKQSFEVAVFCRAPGVAKDAEPVRAWAVQQLCKDRSLGGLVLGVQRISTEWDQEADAQSNFAEVAVLFAVSYAGRVDVL